MCLGQRMRILSIVFTFPICSKNDTMNTSTAPQLARTQKLYCLGSSSGSDPSSFLVYPSLASSSGD